jgi:hypothetical protein
MGRAKKLVSKRDSQIEILQRQVDDLTKSDTRGKIVWAILGSQWNGSHVGIIVNLSNEGASSAIDPQSWKFSAHKAGQEYIGLPNTLLDKNLDFCLGTQKTMRFVRKDALYLKASEPIGRNGFIQGFLWFAVAGLPDTGLKDPSTVLRLQGKV